MAEHQKTKICTSSSRVFRSTKGRGARHCHQGGCFSSCWFLHIIVSLGGFPVFIRIFCFLLILDLVSILSNISKILGRHEPDYQQCRRDSLQPFDACSPSFPLHSQPFAGSPVDGTAPALRRRSCGAGGPLPLVVAAASAPPVGTTPSGLRSSSARLEANKDGYFVELDSAIQVIEDCDYWAGFHLGSSSIARLQRAWREPHLNGTITWDPSAQWEVFTTAARERNRTLLWREDGVSEQQAEEICEKKYGHDGEEEVESRNTTKTNKKNNRLSCVEGYHVSEYARCVRDEARSMARMCRYMWNLLREELPRRAAVRKTTYFQELVALGDLGNVLVEHQVEDSNVDLDVSKRTGATTSGPRGTSTSNSTRSTGAVADVQQHPPQHSLKDFRMSSSCATGLHKSIGWTLGTVGVLEAAFRLLVRQIVDATGTEAPFNDIFNGPEMFRLRDSENLLNRWWIPKPNTKSSDVVPRPNESNAVAVAVEEDERPTSMLSQLPFFDRMELLEGTGELGRQALRETYLQRRSIGTRTRSNSRNEVEVKRHSQLTVPRLHEILVKEINRLGLVLDRHVIQPSQKVGLNRFFILEKIGTRWVDFQVTVTSVWRSWQDLFMQAISSLMHDVALRAKWFLVTLREQQQVARRTPLPMKKKSPYLQLTWPTSGWTMSLGVRRWRVFCDLATKALMEKVHLTKELLRNSSTTTPGATRGKRKKPEVVLRLLEVGVFDARTTRRMLQWCVREMDTLLREKQKMSMDETVEPEESFEKLPTPGTSSESKPQVVPSFFLQYHGIDPWQSENREFALMREHIGVADEVRTESIVNNAPSLRDSRRADGEDVFVAVQKSLEAVVNPHSTISALGGTGTDGQMKVVVDETMSALARDIGSGREPISSKGPSQPPGEYGSNANKGASQELRDRHYATLSSWHVSSFLTTSPPAASKNSEGGSPNKHGITYIDYSDVEDAAVDEAALNSTNPSRSLESNLAEVDAAPVIDPQTPGIFIHRGTSLQASKRIAEVDVTFIDGDHSYEGCSTDIALFASKTKHYISGHDFNADRFVGVCDAVLEAFGTERITLDADYTWWLPARTTGIN
ncbi:unnamed protein product [Amoebophrya sp. A25]|nr:unnamed protein product [Amoebophrya sp. A25]|eukprot:GSA25T00010821001.1